MDSVDLYVRDVGRYPTLTWEEQLALFRRRPDAEAERQLAEANLRLVVAAIRRLKRRNEVFEDLIQVGNLALLAAIQKFDVSRGFRFSSYLSKTIWQHLLRHRHQDRLIYAGQNPLLNPEHAAQASRMRDVPCFSQFDSEAAFDPHGVSQLDPATIAVHREQMRLLARKIGGLSKRSKQILSMRKAGKSYDEIGERFGISKQRVEQLVRRSEQSLMSCASN